RPGCARHGRACPTRRRPPRRSRHRRTGPRAGSGFEFSWFASLVQVRFEWSARPAAEPSAEAAELAAEEEERHGRRAGGRELQDALLDREPEDVRDHWNTSEVESPPWSRTSCARAGPSGRSWKSTKKSGSTAIDPSSATSTLSRYELSSG